MGPLTRLVPRRLGPVALERARDEPVVLLQGPRSVGKSTLLRDLADEVGARVLDLDDLATRDVVRADPATFVAGPEPSSSTNTNTLLSCSMPSRPSSTVMVGPDGSSSPVRLVTNRCPSRRRRSLGDYIGSPCTHCPRGRSSASTSSCWRGSSRVVRRSCRDDRVARSVRTTSIASSQVDFPCHSLGRPRPDDPGGSTTTCG